MSKNKVTKHIVQSRRFEETKKNKIEIINKQKKKISEFKQSYSNLDTLLNESKNNIKDFFEKNSLSTDPNVIKILNLIIDNKIVNSREVSKLKLTPKSSNALKNLLSEYNNLNEQCTNNLISSKKAEQDLIRYIKEYQDLQDLILNNNIKNLFENKKFAEMLILIKTSNVILNYENSDLLLDFAKELIEKYDSPFLLKLIAKHHQDISDDELNELLNIQGDNNDNAEAPLNLTGEESQPESNCDRSL